MTETNPVETQIKKKDRVTGKVVKITLAGAVVDIGLAKPAVLPISQLRKEAVHRVEDVVKEGDQVEAWVRRVDSEQGRVELTLIQPIMLEWNEIMKDAVLKGRVSKLDKFGAFVDLGAERPGLVHISEMSNEYVKKPEDVAKVGDEVEVKVLDVDRRKKQIRLSMKALLPVVEKAKQPTQSKPKKQNREAEKQEQEEPEKPAPTAMEVALRKAISNESEAEPQEKRPAKVKKIPVEIEEMLERTLENRVKSK